MEGDEAGLIFKGTAHGVRMHGGWCCKIQAEVRTFTSGFIDPNEIHIPGIMVTTHLSGEKKSLRRREQERTVRKEIDMALGKKK
jgi:3-oxoacid CoA-transferase subunit A